ncbi:MAG: domain S-box [Proteobacteria bacterium]|nr:domain S-box [Pseudomonadota bacterium]
MKIRHKLKLVILMSLALGLLLGAIFFWAEREIEGVERSKETVSEISEKIFELTLLGQDFALHPGELRAQSQWLTEHRSLGESLRQIDFDDPDRAIVLNRLRKEHAKLLRLFEQRRMQTVPGISPGTASLAGERRDWTLLRMSFSAHSMIADALSLNRWMRIEITDYRRAVYLFALVLAGLTTTIIALLAYLVGRSITGPLARLREDTNIIGAGNLQYRVALPYDDELGELSRDFDRMLEQLREVTASREELRREVVERLRAEDELRSSEEVLKEAQNIAHLGNWEWDIASGKLRWSDEIYRIFGQQPGTFEATYQNFLAVVHPDDRAWVTESVKQALAGAPYDIDHRIRLADGRERVVHEAAKVIVDDAGKPVRMIGTVHDITEYKRLEAELRRLNESLEKRVAEEVEKNREQDLILSQQARLAAMGQMIHNIAHQWKQPINALAIVLANLKDDYDYHELTAESLHKTLKRSRRLLERMSTTIDDFSNFFRPDREAVEFEIDAAVEEALSIMSASLANHQIELVKALSPGLKARGYPNQFAHAVLNVIANGKEAIQQHAVPAGRIEIRLDEEHGMGKLTLQDNGGGIPAEILTQIFDPYFTTKEQGSGIGLYMTKLIIERNLKGTIEVTNRGDGTLCAISLPLVTPNGTESADATP